MLNPYVSRIGAGVHVANFLPYWLDKLGKDKLADLRVHDTPKPPWRVLAVGDTLFVKDAFGPIVASTDVARVEFVELEPGNWQPLEQYYPLLCLTPEFIAAKKSARYATVIFFGPIHWFHSPLSYTLPAETSWDVVDLNSQFTHPSNP